MNQRAFAVAVGHGDQWASNLFNGTFTLTMDDLDIVAKVLRVPPGDIVRESHELWELSPTEMRVVRALRMLPPPVRDDYARYADYLIGTVPDEIEDLVVIRELSPENRATARQWTTMLLRAQVSGRDEAGLAALLRIIEPPAAPARRNRQARTPRTAAKK